MLPRQIDAMTELQNAFKLLFNNWILALPTAISSLLFMVLFFFFVAAAIGSMVGAGALGGDHPTGAMALLSGFGVVGFVLFIVAALVALVANATVVAAAQDVWKGRGPDLGGAVGQAMGKLPHLIVAAIIIALLAIIPGLLAIFFIGFLLLIALGFFMMYVVPGIMVGGESGSSAIGASFRLAKENFGPSALAFVGIVVVVVAGQIVSTIFSHIIGLNFIVAFVVGGLASAYGALVSVRFYDLLKGGAPPAVATGSAPPPMPTSNP